MNQMVAALDRLKVFRDLSKALANADIVIENVPEILFLKTGRMGGDRLFSAGKNASYDKQFFF